MVYIYIMENNQNTIKPLNPSDLMIGNLVLDSTKNTTVVENIVHGDNRVRYGITLTEEWLLRFGFIKLDTSDIFYVLGYNMQLKVSECLTMVAWHNLMLHDVKIKYVHQLQNLYYLLTGEKLK